MYHVVILTALKTAAVLSSAEKKSEKYLLPLGMRNGWKGSGDHGHDSSLITDSWILFFSSVKLSSGRLWGWFLKINPNLL